MRRFQIAFYGTMEKKKKDTGGAVSSLSIDNKRVARSPGPRVPGKESL